MFSLYQGLYLVFVRVLISKIGPWIAIVVEGQGQGRQYPCWFWPAGYNYNAYGVHVTR